MKYKILFAALGSLAASISFACPNLEGTFACPGDDNHPGSSVVVTQAPLGNYTSYSVQVRDATGTDQGTEQILADGLVRDVDSAYGPAKESFNCEGDAALRMDYSFNHPQAGAVAIVSRFAINSARALTQDTLVTFAQGQQEQHRVCVRQ